VLTGILIHTTEEYAAHLHIYCQGLYNLYFSLNLIAMTKERRTQNLACMGRVGNSQKHFVENLEGKRPVWRVMRRAVDNIKILSQRQRPTP
jgi:hypothetical protein